jgi:site-specific DNA recombinase
MSYDQQFLAENRQSPKRRLRATKRSLLTGILFDDSGNRLTPTHANKAGKRYRYYTSQSIIRKAGSGTSMTRIPANELDQAVLGRIEAFLSSDDDLFAVARGLGLLGRPLESFFRSACEAAASWTELTADTREELAKSALLNVVVLDHQIEIQLRFLVLLDWRQEPDYPLKAQSELHSGQSSDVFTLTCSFIHMRRGQALRLIIDGAEPTHTSIAYALLKGIARARKWYEQIVSGEVGGIPKLAKKEGVTPRYVRKILPCMLLGPQGVECILAGKCSPDLTLDRLVNKLPLEWDRQERLLNLR